MKPQPSSSPGNEVFWSLRSGEIFNNPMQMDGSRHGRAATAFQVSGAPSPAVPDGQVRRDSPPPLPKQVIPLGQSASTTISDEALPAHLCYLSLRQSAALATVDGRPGLQTQHRYQPACQQPQHQYLLRRMSNCRWQRAKVTRSQQQQHVFLPCPIRCRSQVRMADHEFAVSSALRTDGANPAAAQSVSSQPHAARPSLLQARRDDSINNHLHLHLRLPCTWVLAFPPCPPIPSSNWKCKIGCAHASTETCKFPPNPTIHSPPPTAAAVRSAQSRGVSQRCTAA